MTKLSLNKSCYSAAALIGILTVYGINYRCMFDRNDRKIVIDAALPPGAYEDLYNCPDVVDIITRDIPETEDLPL
jgi:hypothetical protein